jgi:hypothetical protein
MKDEIPKNSCKQRKRRRTVKSPTRPEQTVRLGKVDLAAVLDRARRLRQKTQDHPLTDNELQTEKQMGRP